MKRRVLSAALALAMAMTLVPMAAFAENEVTVETPVVVMESDPAATTGTTEDAGAGMKTPVETGENATITINDSSALASAIQNQANGQIWNFSANTTYELNQMMNITADNITLNLNGSTITAASAFTGSSENAKHLVNVHGENVTIQGGTLKTTATNKHVLNVYGADGFKASNLTLDHTDSWKGAPLVVNGCTAEISGTFTTITGANSWYAVNVDNKVGENQTAPASLTFTDNAQVNFQGVNPVGIKLETYQNDNNVSVTFADTAAVTTFTPNFLTVMNAGAEEKVQVTVPATWKKGNGDKVFLAPGNDLIHIDGTYYLTLDQAIQAAADNATITVPAGTYQLNTTLAINRNITLVGAVDANGAPATILQGENNNNRNGVEISGTGTVTLQNLRFTQFGGEGQSNNVILAGGAAGTFTGKLVMDNCAIDEFGKNGITVKGGTAEISNTLVDVTNVNNVANRAPNGIQIDNNATAVITGVTIKDATSTSEKWSATGIMALRGGQITQLSNCRFENCQNGISLPLAWQDNDTASIPGTQGCTFVNCDTNVSYELDDEDNLAELLNNAQPGTSISLYGNYTVTEPLTVPAGVSLSVANGTEGLGSGKVGSLTIPKGASLTVEQGATLSVSSGATLTNDGTVTNNGTIEKAPGATIDGTGEDNGAFDNLPATVTTVEELKAAINAAQPGDKIKLAAGTYDVGTGLQITKRVNLVGENGAVIVGPVQYMFSENQNGATVTVENLTIRANDSDVQGLNFRGNGTNNGYNVKIEVKNCAFDGWKYGVTMNSHANGYNMTVSGCDFTDSLYAVSYNYDTTTPGQEAENTVTFGEGNKIASYGFAVQKFSNSVAENYNDKTYQTIENFVKDQPTIEGTVAYVKTADQLATTISSAKDGTTIILAPGNYGTDNITFGGKSLTIKAQYPAYVNGQKTEDSELTKFGGTFYTGAGSAANSFQEDQHITIDGIALYGDGLKIGTTNWSTIGNLTVRNCTMSFGESLSESTIYNKSNKFIYVNGGANGAYANFVVENNYISGTPENQQHPILLWGVKSATVRNNVFELTNAESIQAINVSKMATNATVDVTGNTVNGAGSGIAVTTWKLGGNETNGAATFAGSVTIKDNTLNVTEDPIFVGYDKDAASGSNAYGLLGGTQVVSGNTNNGSAVVAEIVRGPEGTEVTSITATVMDGDTVISSISGTPVNGKLSVTLPAALTKPGYHFDGWRAGSALYQAGQTVEISTNTTFTAQWTYIPPVIDNGGGSVSGDYIVSVDKTTGGKVTVTPGRADKGDTVTITVKPDSGYVLEDLVVTTTDGDYISVSQKDDNKYTFKMPGSKVTVEAIFVKDGQQTVEPETPFVDVTENDWFYEAVLYAYENELMNGTSATTFAPNGNMSRAMIWTVLARMEGVDTTGDVWYQAGMDWAMENGVSDGTDPNGSITREQLATMLYRYEGSPAVTGEVKDFTDADAISDWADDAMLWAIENGFIGGMGDGTVAPQGTATRAQVATILMRFVEAQM